MITDKYIINVTKDQIKGEVLTFPLNINGTRIEISTGIKVEPYAVPDLEWVKAEAYSDGYEDGRKAEKVRTPDLEQIRKEAYNKGQEDLRESCVPQDEEAYGIGYHEGFQCGLGLAWEAARKIENLSEAEKFEIFGEYDMFHIMRRYTATEAIEKIRQYEQAQKEEERPIHAEDVMRQYLDEFCKRRWCCAECVLRTDDFTCGRGYSFTGMTPVSDEEVRRAYAEVMKK